jgi:hypothetical protein
LWRRWPVNSERGTDGIQNADRAVSAFDRNRGFNAIFISVALADEFHCGEGFGEYLIFFVRRDIAQQYYDAADYMIGRGQ